MKICSLTCPSNIGPGVMSKSHWSGVAQVVEKKVVGDTGFEPAASTVCKRHKKKKQVKE